LNFSQILRNSVASSDCDVEIKEENLLDVAIYREVFIENILDQKYKMNSIDEILYLAKQRIGEKGYDLITDNCKHFCNSVDMGLPLPKKLRTPHLKGFSFINN